MKDPSRTPFNIGQCIELEDFTFEEALPLAQAFPRERGSDRRYLAHVFSWTGGHPYLTQVLSSRIVRAGTRIRSLADIDEVVRETFLSTAGDQERNLRFVSDMLTRRAERLGRDQVLLKFRDILSGKIVRDQGQSRVISHLKLAGVIRVVADRLKVRNEIYSRVFDLAWIDRHLGFSWRRIAFKITTRFAMPAVAAAVAALSIAIWAVEERANLCSAQDRLSRVKASLNDTTTKREILQSKVDNLEEREAALEEKLKQGALIVNELKRVEGTHGDGARAMAKKLAQLRLALLAQAKETRDRLASMEKGTASRLLERAGTETKPVDSCRVEFDRLAFKLEKLGEIPKSNEQGGRGDAEYPKRTAQSAE